LKSLEVSEEKANQRVEEFKRQLKSLTLKLKEAENRAELAEKTVKKLQKEVDRLEGRFLGSIPTQCAHTLSVSTLLKQSDEKKKKREILSRRKQENFLFTQCFVVSSAPSRLETIGSMSSCQPPRSMQTKNAFNCFFFYF
jgi:chromosome segregation ATPase